MTNIGFVGPLRPDRNTQSFETAYYLRAEGIHLGSARPRPRRRRGLRRALALRLRAAATARPRAPVDRRMAVPSCAIGEDS